MGKIKIRCEAIAKHSGKRCKCLGRFIPTSRRMLCPYHKGGKSWDNKTRKYKGLYKNENINIQNKINILKNLKNFKHKTDDEIKEYILKEKNELSLSATEQNTILGHLIDGTTAKDCLLYTSPSPRDGLLSRMPSSA